MAKATITLTDVPPNEGETDDGIFLAMDLDGTNEEKIASTRAIVLALHLADLARFGNLKLDKDEVLTRSYRHLVEDNALPAPGAALQ